jgi:predicted transcriptional regulator
METTLIIISMLGYASISEVLASTGLDMATLSAQLRALSDSGSVVLSYGERGQGVGIHDPLGRLWTHVYATG